MIVAELTSYFPIAILAPLVVNECVSNLKFFTQSLIH